MKISDLSAGCAVQFNVLVSKITFSTTKANKDYCDIICTDSTGTVLVKVWDVTLLPEGVTIGDVICVFGECVEFNGELQIKANGRISVVNPATYSIEEFFPASRYSLESLLKLFNTFIEHVQDPWLKLLLEHFFVKDTKFFNKFINAPAAVAVHQNYVHGLLEHTTCVTKNTVAICKNYKNVNADIAITASLLHDIGKVYEISEFPNLDYTDTGHLMGHVYFGAFLVQQACENISGFPEELKGEIVHCILAHSGKLEWGSPVVPSSPEAYVVHLADLLDSRMALFHSALEKVEEGSWTQRNKYLGTCVRKLKYGGPIDG